MANLTFKHILNQELLHRAIGVTDDRAKRLLHTLKEFWDKEPSDDITILLSHASTLCETQQELALVSFHCGMTYQMESCPIHQPKQRTQGPQLSPDVDALINDIFGEKQTNNPLEGLFGGQLGNIFKARTNTDPIVGLRLTPNGVEPVRLSEAAAPLKSQQVDPLAGLREFLRKHGK